MMTIKRKASVSMRNGIPTNTSSIWTMIRQEKIPRLTAAWTLESEGIGSEMCSGVLSSCHAV